MSTKYTGGFITKSPVAPTSSAASGIWTLDQQQQAQKAGTWPSPPIFIEDLFSTYLYTGNDSTQSITNNIDISTKGALVWVKGRSGTYGTFDHTLITTPISNTTALSSNTTGDGFGIGASAFSPTTTGFNLNTASASLNNNGTNYVSWTFRKQPKFFDVVTYTGNGGSSQTINHNLGSVPGCMIVKSTSTVENWKVYHRSLGTPAYQYLLNLNTTDSRDFTTSRWASDPTSTTFTVASNADVNASGVTYVAYLFAHNAGGFGLTGTDNVITCGSYTGNGSASGPTVTLGYEPQFVMIKAAVNVRTSPESYNNWAMVDVMRGMPNPKTGVGYALGANLSTAEDGGFLAANSTVVPTATGFQITANEAMYNFNGATYIYIAIRRGPMKTPTVGTSVFAPVTYAGNSAAQTITAGFRVDMELVGCRTGGQGWEQAFADRLRGNGRVLSSASTGAEVDWSANLTNEFQSNTGTNRTDAYLNFSSLTFVDWMFQRAPGFFDEVCYTGTGTPTNFTHNLGAVPELMIVKRRDDVSIWAVYAAPLANAATNYFQLNNDNAVTTGNTILWNSTAPTSTVFTIGASSNINTVGSTNVAYLFATLAGVSKVGSYTGTGALQTVNCGFTSGARFVLIKRTDSTGDWFTYDSARGITSSNDPYLLMNSTAAEVTGTNYVDTDTTGFKVTAAAPAGLNANGGTYIFLAIA
jgi:hypothetical protein